MCPAPFVDPLLDLARRRAARRQILRKHILTGIRTKNRFHPVLPPRIRLRQSPRLIPRHQHAFALPSLLLNPTPHHLERIPYPRKRRVVIRAIPLKYRKNLRNPLRPYPVRRLPIHTVKRKIPRRLVIKCRYRTHVRTLHHARFRLDVAPHHPYHAKGHQRDIARYQKGIVQTPHEITRTLLFTRHFLKTQTVALPIFIHGAVFPCPELCLNDRPPPIPGAHMHPVLPGAPKTVPLIPRLVSGWGKPPPTRLSRQGGQAPLPSIRRYPLCYAPILCALSRNLSASQISSTRPRHPQNASRRFHLPVPISR